MGKFGKMCCGCFCMLLLAIVPSPNARALDAAYSGFDAPTGIAAGKDGALYVSNWGGGSVERILPDGTRSVFIDGIASPAGIAVDRDGAVYVASYSGDYVVRVGADGSRTKVAENLATPTGLAFSKDGRLLVANRSSGEIVAVDLPSRQKSPLANSLALPVGVVEMPDGSLVVTQYGGRVTRIMPNGTAQEIGKEFSRPGVGIITDGNDAVLAIDNGASVVRRVNFAGQSTVVSEELPGSAVALCRDGSGRVFAGTWGAGNIYVIE